VRGFQWTGQAKGEFRQLERDDAMRILLALTEYAKTGQGDIKQLQASGQFRLRVGNYRVRFIILNDGTIRILHVRHWKEAYRD
jgi:mRNA-degrading endonuclease RelE of RelBE toxin-antitoxin system